MTIFSANAAGMARKSHSLTHELKECSATIFSIQETNYKKKGRYVNNEYEIFEAIRKNKEKGGTMLGIHKSLNPVLIEEYSETFELLVTEVKVVGKEIRVITGYGPQESWSDVEKMPFFVTLEEEISKAQMAGKSIIIELDANSKLGPKYIENDPKEMSPNGKILGGIIERHALVVANGIKGKSKGVITRQRSTRSNSEESTIDFVILSSDLTNALVSLHIDEERKSVLTSITHTKKGIVKHESDHNSIITQINIKWEKKKEPDRIEIFNFKDIEGQKKFRELTHNTDILSKIFETEDSIHTQTKRFPKRFNRILHQSFKKIRIRPEKDTNIDKLFRQQTDLKTKTDKESKQKLKQVEEELAKKMAEDLYNIVKEEVKVVESDEGGFNSGHLWRIKNKLRPKNKMLPTALMNKEGQIVTSSEEIKMATMEHYKEVLKNRTIKPHLQEYKEDREKLFRQRIKIASKNITPEWSVDAVQNVIKNLKKTQIL